MSLNTTKKDLANPDSKSIQESDVPELLQLILNEARLTNFYLSTMVGEEIKPEDVEDY